MDLQQLKKEMEHLHALVGGWQQVDEITPIERDLALARLRDLYEAIRFGVEKPVPEQLVDAVETVPSESLVQPEPEPVTLDASAFIALDTLLEEPLEEADLKEAAAETSVGIEEEAESAQPVVVESEVGENENVAMEPAVTAEIEQVQPESEPEPEPSAESEPEPEPSVEPDRVSEPETEPIEATEPEAISAPQPEATPATHNLFGEEEQATVRHRHKQRVIMSLYDAAPEPVKQREPELRIETLLPPESEVIVVEAEPEVIEVSEEELLTPMPSQTKVHAVAATETVADEPLPQPTLGEVMPHVQTLADKLATERETVAEVHREPITDLRRAVGINDKFLLIHELFNGNGSLYEITIRRLNEFDNLDDCMIYIAENFAWNPNSDGAKLMMDLLERKFLA